jgi:hypothetical protein
MPVLSFGRVAACVSAAVALLVVTPVRAQEAWMVVSHQVEDFDRWKEVFDAAFLTRRAVGERGAYILHNGPDRTRVTVWFTWDTLENAKAFASDPALVNGMAAAGVISTPRIHFPLD